MKLVLLIVALFGAVSGDISEIINSSRQYLPPSREYLPPPLPEYMQSPPETSPYVQDPPIFTDVVEILGAVETEKADSFTEEEVFIPVQVVSDNNEDSVASLRQYLPPLTVSTTVLPQLPEETIENQTSPQASVIEDDSLIQSKEFIESTTPEVISEVDNETSVATEGASPLEANKGEDTEDTVVITTAAPDTVAPVTTEALDIVTVEDVSDVSDATTVSSDATSESVAEAIEDDATTENIQAVTAAADIKEIGIDDIQTTTEGIEITTVDSAPAVEVHTETATEAIQTSSTTDANEVTTSDSASATTEDSVSEDSPIATTMAPVDAVTTESEAITIQVLSTTIPEYIQKSQNLQVAGEEILSESLDTVRGNDLEATEVASEAAEAETKVSTPDTLLLEDGYHYSIPSILFG